MIALFQNDLLKILKRSMFWIETLILIAIPAIVIVPVLGIVQVTGMMINGQSNVQAISAEELIKMRSVITFPTAPAADVWSQILNPTGLVGILILILSGSMIIQEYQWRTVHLSASRGIPRLQIVLSKFLAQFTAGVLMILITQAAVLFGQAISTLIIKGSLASAAQVDWLRMIVNMVIDMVTLLSYLAIVFVIATLTRSLVATIGAYFLIGMGEYLLSELLKAIGPGSSFVSMLLPYNQYQVLLAWNSGSSGQPNPILALSLLLVITGGLLAFAIMTFRRQDLPAY